MTADLPFQSPYRHGFVRVAVAAPRLHLAQPAANAEETVRLARIADDRGAALVVFPELGLSGYSVDDLFHQQGLLGAVREAVHHAGRAPAPACARCWWSALRSFTKRSSSTAPWSSTAAGSSASFPSPTCPTTASSTRSGSSPAPRWRSAREIDLSGQPVPFGAAGLPRSTAGRSSRSTSRSARTCGSRCRPAPGARMAGATVLCNLSASNATVGKADYRDAAVRVALGPLHRRLPLRRRRLRRVDHRPGLGRPGDDLRERRSAGGGRALLDREPDRLRRRRPRAARARPHADDQLPGLDRRPPRAARGASARCRSSSSRRAGDARARAPRRALPLRAQRPRAPRRALRRGLPHPGAGAGAAAGGDRHRARGARRLRRPRLDAGAAGGGQDLRPARPLARATSWPTPCRGSPPATTRSTTRAS